MACVVALDLTAGVAVLSARGPASGDRKSPETLAVRAGDSNPAPDGILAGGQFTNRRGSGRASTSSTSTVTSPAPTSTTPPSTGGSTTTASGPRATSTTRPVTSSTGAPATTSTSRPPAARSGTPGQNGAAGQPGADGSEGANGSAGTPAAGGATPTTLAFDDRKADTVAQGTTKSKPEPRADIVQTHVSYETGRLVFSVRVGQWVDPRQDPNWASESTYVDWEIDTDGDGKPDYEVQYFLSEGTPVAGVSRAGDDTGDSVCVAESGYAAHGDAVAIDPACFNAPASFSYRVSMYYDSDPKNEDADVLTDVAPDGGLSRPVPRPA
jgi:hypothetical protein